MKRRWRVLGSAFLFLGICLAAGCAADVDDEDAAVEDIAEPFGLTPSWQGPSGHHGHHPSHGGPHSGRCSVELEGDVVTLEFAGGDGFPPPGISVSRRVRADRSGAIATDIRVKLGNRDLFRSSVDRAADGSVRMRWSYSLPIRGIREAVIVSTDGTTGVATIDGRVSQPFALDSATPATFLDGRPAPRVRIGPRLQKAVAAALAETAEEASKCWDRKLEHVSVDDRDSGQAPGPETNAPADVPSDPGKPADAPIGVDCILLGVGCQKAAEACIGLGAWASTLCGPWAGACTGGAIGACLVGYGICFDHAARSPICCPTFCGGNLVSGYECCRGEETCLSESRNTCCSPGHAPCRGLECCAEGKECCPNPISGVDNCCVGEEFCSSLGCCTNERSCNSVCCADDEVCFAPLSGTCCKANQVCGSACCASDTTGNPIQYCAEAGLCCAIGAVTCGGQCCGIGQVCTNGTCSAPPTGCTFGPCVAPEDCTAIPSDTPLKCVDNCCILDAT